MIGRKNRPILTIVIGRSNYLAGLMALMLGVVLWLGQPLILGLIASQADLIASIDTYWIWMAMLLLASFSAFQMDGIFIGATRSKEMRNAMLIASVTFIAAVQLIPFGLIGLMGSFVGYLALRRISLWYLIGYVYKTANPADGARLSDEH